MGTANVNGCHVLFRFIVRRNVTLVGIRCEACLEKKQFEDIDYPNMVVSDSHDCSRHEQL
jgi:hypothetical protein